MLPFMPFLAPDSPLRLHNTALATLVGVGVNLLNSSPIVSVAQVRSAQVTPLDGTAIKQAGVENILNFNMVDMWGVELPADTGVIVSPGNVNQSHAGFFEWIET